MHDGTLEGHKIPSPAKGRTIRSGDFYHFLVERPGGCARHAGVSEGVRLPLQSDMPAGDLVDDSFKCTG